MAQWADLITEAAADIGVAPAGQIISPSFQNDAFLRLQQMLAAWSLDQLLAIYQVQHAAFNFVPNSYAYTIGPSGQFVTSGTPIRITGGSSVFNGGAAGIQRKAMRLVSIDEFHKEINDPVSSLALLPEVLGVDRAFPNINLRVWRTPTSSTAFMELNWWTPMSPPVNVTDIVSTPPEFQLAIQKNLALKLYPQYARERGVDPILVKDAGDYLEVIRSINRAMLGEGQPAQQAPNPPSAG